jgi:hypothetical protein
MCVLDTNAFREKTAEDSMLRRVTEQNRRSRKPDEHFRETAPTRAFSDQVEGHGSSVIGTKRGKARSDRRATSTSDFGMELAAARRRYRGRPT